MITDFKSILQKKVISKVIAFRVQDGPKAGIQQSQYKHFKFLFTFNKQHIPKDFALLAQY